MARLIGSRALREKPLRESKSEKHGRRGPQRHHDTRSGFGGSPHDVDPLAAYLPRI